MEASTQGNQKDAMRERMLINITAAHHVADTLLLPCTVNLSSCVLFLLRQSAWHRASFQNQPIVSSDGFVPPSLLAYDYYYYGMHEEDNHEPNTIVITTLEDL